MDKSSETLGRTSAYEYECPDELIAAHPADRRDESRLLVGDRDGEAIQHTHFKDLVEFLEPDDLLVLNDTKVVPARILTHKKETGGRVELMVIDLIEPGGDNKWERPASGELVMRCMTKSSNPPRVGMELVSKQDEDVIFEIENYADGEATVRVDSEASAIEFLAEYGQTPLPPYILNSRGRDEEYPVTDADRHRYQTVYANNPGSVAAPTAGLHFTENIFEQLTRRGVHTETATLEVGPGTFRPVSTDRLDDHDMHTERYEVPEPLGPAIQRARARGGRIIAVGTTSARLLETEARKPESFEPGSYETDLFIRPGVDFEICDGLITNFHLPRSTLLALVAAFAGYDFMWQMYREALEREYRLYSYGDAMLIL